MHLSPYLSIWQQIAFFREGVKLQTRKVYSVRWKMYFYVSFLYFSCQIEESDKHPRVARQNFSTCTPFPLLLNRDFSRLTMDFGRLNMGFTETDTAALTHAAVSVFVNSLFGELKSLFGILIFLFSSNKKGICCVVWHHHIRHPAFDTKLIWKQCEGMLLHHTKCLIFCPRFHVFTTKSNLLL